MDSALIKSGINAYKNAQSIAPKGSGAADNSVEIVPLNNTDGGAGSFANLLNDSFEKASDTGYKTEVTGLKSIAKQASPVDLVTAVTQAELTLQTVVALRDRVINAYQDIVKMPI